MLMVQSVVADINRRTGESECQYYKDRLLYTEDGQRNDLIDRSRTLSCHGELKNNRGLVSRFLTFYTHHQNPQYICNLSTSCFLKIQFVNSFNCFLYSLLFNNSNLLMCSLSLCFSLFPETSRLSVPGHPGHHQVRLAERSAGQLPALPSANPHPAAGPGGPIRRRDESWRVHQGGLQQQRAELVVHKYHRCYTMSFILFA